MPACVLCVTTSLLHPKRPHRLSVLPSACQGDKSRPDMLVWGQFASEDTHITKSDQQPTCRKKFECKDQDHVTTEIKAGIFR